MIAIALLVAFLLGAIIGAAAYGLSCDLMAQRAEEQKIRKWLEQHPASQRELQRQ